MPSQSNLEHLEHVRHPWRLYSAKRSRSSYLPRGLFVSISPNSCFFPSSCFPQRGRSMPMDCVTPKRVPQFCSVSLFPLICDVKDLLTETGCVGTPVVIMTQFFAPTSIRLTYDSSSLGRDDLPDWIARDPKTGRVKSLNWPKKLVIISNHQMYADWWYIWLLAYFARVHAYILIILKKSLKWAPVLGWVGCCFWSRGYSLTEVRTGDAIFWLYLPREVVGSGPPEPYLASVCTCSASHDNNNGKSRG